MKTQDEIRKRLKNLRERYARKFIEDSQARMHVNCIYNHEHIPTKNTSVLTNEDHVAMVPRRHVTLVVLNEPKSICICTYGSENSNTWNGDICDNDAIAKSCKVFKPILDLEQAKEDFMELMADDEYVFHNYRDIATLQWVLNERVYEQPLTWLEKLAFWIHSKLFSNTKPTHLLAKKNLPDDFWGSSDDSSKNT